MEECHIRKNLNCKCVVLTGINQLSECGHWLKDGSAARLLDTLASSVICKGVITLLVI